MCRRWDDEVGDGQHVVGAHARGQQRLVGVAECGVGEQQALLLRGPLGEAFGAELVEQLARAVGRRAGDRARGTGAARMRVGRGLPATSGLPLTITSPR